MSRSLKLIRAARPSPQDKRGLSGYPPRIKTVSPGFAGGQIAFYSGLHTRETRTHSVAPFVLTRRFTAPRSNAALSAGIKCPQLG
jgi:hypothetical protein